MMKLSTTRFILALLFVSALGLWSCTECIDTHSPNVPRGAYFHEETNTWIRWRQDPYELANFQRAYDNLSAGRSSQALTTEQAAAFTGSERLRATNYYLKIYPRSESEQSKVEHTEGVFVAYIPFDYIEMTPTEVEELKKSQSKIQAYPDKNPHTQIYDDLESPHGGPQPPVTISLPIIYAVWPCGMPLPKELEYRKVYDVFLPQNWTRPQSSALTPEAMTILEQEAINLALGL